MKEIQTIFCTIDCSCIFDRSVNEALADGWSLLRRDVVVPHQTDRAPILYAELERAVALKVTVGVTEPCCGNCKYTDRGLSAEPCCSCEDQNGIPDHWEAGS